MYESAETRRKSLTAYSQDTVWIAHLPDGYERVSLDARPVPCSGQSSMSQASSHSACGPTVGSVCR